jgi:hypothetical protein
LRHSTIGLHKVTRRSLLLIALVPGCSTAPYTLETAIQPDQLHVSGPVKLKIVLTNRSNATVRIGQRSTIFDWQYELTNEGGSPLIAGPTE